MKLNTTSAGCMAFVSGLLGCQAWAGSVAPLPTPYPLVRYEHMSAVSPFATATATGPAAAAPGFAALLYVAGVARLGHAEYVAIKSRDTDKPVSLFLQVGESSADGMTVERLNWSDEIGKSTVDVTKGSEKATLEFDEAQMVRSVPAPPPPMPRLPRGVRQIGSIRIISAQ